MVQSKLNSPFVTQNIVFSFNRPRAKFFGCFLGRAMASMEASQKRGKKHLCLFQLSVILFWERFPLFRELFFVFFFSFFFEKSCFFFSVWTTFKEKSTSILVYNQVRAPSAFCVMVMYYPRKTTWPKGISSPLSVRCGFFSSGLFLCAKNGSWESMGTSSMPPSHPRGFIKGVWSPSLTNLIIELCVWNYT